MMGSVDAVFGQTITIDPNATGSPVSSHVIGAVRNHTQYQADYYNPNNPTYTAIGNYTAKLDAYSNIVPRFGSQRKLYRLGGSPIDGKGEYEGYFSPTANYGTGSNFPQNVADSYPYDDFHFFVEEAQAMGADMVVGINVGAGSPQNALKFIKEEVLPLNILDQIAYFELGNELYGYWQIGHNMYGCSPEVYRERAAEFIDYFENHLDPAVFMNMKFALMGSYNGAWATYGTTAWITQNGNQFTVHNSPTWTPVNPTFEWSPAPDAGQGQWTATYNNPPADIQVEFRQNGVMVDNLSTTLNCPTSPSSPVGAAAIISSYVDPSSPLMKNGVPKFHFIAYHNYVNNHEFAKDGEFCSGLGNLSDTEKFGQIMATSPYYRDQIIDANNILTNLNVKLAMTEYGTNSSLAHTITEGLHAAENIMDAIRYDMDGAMAFCFLHSWGDFNDNLFFKHGGGNVVRYPVFYVQQLIAENTGSFFLPTVSNGSPQMDVSLCPKDQNGNNIIFNIDVFEQVVTKDNDGTLYLLMLNKDMSNSLPITINGISSDQYFANHIFYHGSSITDAPTAIESNNCIDFGNVTLQPLSVNVLRLTPVNTAFFADITCTSASFKGPEGNPDDYTYLWDFGDGSNSTDLHPVHTYNTSTTQTYTVTLTITSPNGCTKVVSKDIDVIVPPINQDYTYTINADCSVSFTGPTGNPSNTTYSWDFGDGSTSTDQNPSHTYTDNGSYSVVLTVTDGCGNSVSETHSVGIDCLSAITCPCEGYGAFNIEAGDGLKWSETTAGQQWLLFDPCIAISGKLIIDKHAQIINGELRMSPGAEIVIQSGGWLDLEAVHSKQGNSGKEGVHGCNKMWKGITIENGGALLLTNDAGPGTVIQDAEYAVKALGGAHFVSYKTKFINNNVSLYVPPPVGSGWNPIHQNIPQLSYPTGFTENHIYGTGSMLPLYAGQTTTVGKFPYAGIWLNNASFHIGKSWTASGKNVFSNLYNGIVGYRSGIFSWYSDMKNIIYDANTPGFSQGVGIYSIFGGYTNSKKNTIENAKSGIVLLSCDNASITDNKITDVEDAIRMGNMANLTKVDGNIISNYKNGISISSANIPGKFSISHNLLKGSIPKIYNGFGAGIHLDHVSAPSVADGLVLGNTIMVNEKIKDGILLYAINNLGVQDNIIELDKKAKGTMVGFLLSNSGDNIFYQNTVQRLGWSSDYNSYGFLVASSPDNTFCCNATDRTRNGFFFESSNDNTTFRNNAIKAHTRGLYVNGIIGQQKFAGNTWGSFVGSSNDPISEKGNAVIPPQFQNLLESSKFTVSTCTGAYWPAVIIPNQGCPGNTNDWFQQKTDGTDSECNTDPQCVPPREFVRQDPKITENDIRAAKGELEHFSLGYGLPWDKSKQLYRKLLTNPTLLGSDDAIDDFFLQKSDDVVGDLVALSLELEQVLKVPEAVQAERNLNTVILTQAIDELSVVDSLFELASTKADTTLLSNQRIELLQSISDVLEQDQAIKLEQDAIKEDKLISLRKANAQIDANSRIVQYEKFVNDLYIQTMSNKQVSFDEYESNMLFEIANSCSWKFGDVVFAARNLYRLVDETKVFDEDKICNLGQDENINDNAPKMTDFKENRFLIHPNPTNSYVQVYWPLDLESTKNVRIDILKPMGKLVKSLEFSGIDGQKTFELPMQPGIYTVNFYLDGQFVENQTLIIIE